MYVATDLWQFYTARKRVSIILTGGTIAKTYEPKSGGMQNDQPVIGGILKNLRIDDLKIELVDLMQIDSLRMKDDDRGRLASMVCDLVQACDALIVTHGTDTMMESADTLIRQIPDPPVPVVFTGAMIPHVVEGSDATQNLTESLLAIRLLPPGFFVVFHNRVLTLPGVEKDYRHMTFVDRPD